MNIRLLPTFLIGLIIALSAPRVSAEIDIDFRLELGWRADYEQDFDAAIVLYEYSYYRGRRLVLYPGEQIADFYDYEWGFRVRSVEVLGPVNVVLFDESGLWGHQLTLYSNVEDLGDYRMRLNDYSTFSWYRRARSAYVSYNAPDYRVSVEIGPRIFPRVFCAIPIIPFFFDHPHHRNYTHPRPRWDNAYGHRHVPLPPPNARIYRPDRRGPGGAPPIGPNVRPPRRTPPEIENHPNRPPNTPPPITPPGRPGSISTPPDPSNAPGAPVERPRRIPPSRVEEAGKTQSAPTEGTKPQQTRPPNNKSGQSPAARPSPSSKQRGSTPPTTRPSRKKSDRSPNPQGATPPPRSTTPRAEPPSRPSNPPRNPTPPEPDER